MPRVASKLAPAIPASPDGRDSTLLIGSFDVRTALFTAANDNFVPSPVSLLGRSPQAESHASSSAEGGGESHAEAGAGSQGDAGGDSHAEASASANGNGHAEASAAASAGDSTSTPANTSTGDSTSTSAITSIGDSTSTSLNTDTTSLSRSHTQTHSSTLGSLANPQITDQSQVPPESSEVRTDHHSSAGIIVGIVIGVLVAILLIILLTWCLLRKRRRRLVLRDKSLSAIPWQVTSASDSDTPRKLSPEIDRAVTCERSPNRNRCLPSLTPPRTTLPLHRPQIESSTTMTMTSAPEGELLGLRRQVEMLLSENARLAGQLQPPAYHQNPS